MSQATWKKGWSVNTGIAQAHSVYHARSDFITRLNIENI